MIGLLFMVALGGVFIGVGVWTRRSKRRQHLVAERLARYCTR